jgi:hypothetical protein
MPRDTGFFQLRRGIWEHVRDGRMSITEALAFIYIGTQGDTRTGIWYGSAKSLAGELGLPDRTARDVLEKMEHGDYIRRFAVPGRHSCYPILVHKFLITSGQHTGEQLNAFASTSPADLAYFPREQSVELNGEHGVEHGAAQKKLETVKGRGKKKDAPASPLRADPRFQPFYRFAFEGYAQKRGQKPTWLGKDRKLLQNLLRATAAPLTELERRWRNYLASTEPFTVKQGDSLGYFCSNIDKFSDGPLLAFPMKGGSNATNRADNLRGIASSLGLAPQPAN